MIRALGGVRRAPTANEDAPSDARNGEIENNLYSLLGVLRVIRSTTRFRFFIHNNKVFYTTRIGRNTIGKKRTAFWV